MRIAVCANGRDMDSPVDDRFGRCPYFLLFDQEGNHLQTLTNPSLDSPQGAGIGAAQLLINNRVDVVLTEKMGPKAIRPLQAAGIKIFTGISGSAAQSLAKYRRGELTPLEKANASGRGKPGPAVGGG